MKIYEYTDYIMSFFRKMNCKEGQGLFLLRSIDATARKDGYTQETINILHRVIHVLLCNEFINVDSDCRFFKLTERGFQYTQGARDISIKSYLSFLVDYNKDSNQLYNDLWLMIGRENIAPYYVKGPDFYNTILPFLSLGISYSEYIEGRRNRNLSTSRVVWYKELITQLSKENFEKFALDLSAKIDKLIDEDIKRPTEEGLDFEFKTVMASPIASVLEPASKDILKKKVFISYTHEDEEHDQWVKHLADCLKGTFDVIIDYKEPLGIELSRFMEQAVNDSDKVLLILTPGYKSKADSRVAGVGYETQLITAEIYNRNNIKFIPLVRKGDFNHSYPIYLGSRKGLDMRDDALFETNLNTLIENLQNY